MAFGAQSFAGTIRIDPDQGDFPAACDDSTLDALLSSFAHRLTLSEMNGAPRSSACPPRVRRLSWFEPSDMFLRADVVRLADELEAAFLQLQCFSS